MPDCLDLAREKTTKCPQQFACLTAGDGTCPKCEVASSSGIEVLFLASKTHMSCPYRLTFGYSQVCTCPLHYAVHRKGRGKA